MILASASVHAFLPGLATRMLNELVTLPYATVTGIAPMVFKAAPLAGLVV